MSIFKENNKDAVLTALQDNIDRALEAMGLQAEAYVKLLAPVDTGRLKNSITHTQKDSTHEAIGTDVEYAKYVEMGTQKTAAQPYLFPAISNHLSEYRDIAEEYLRGGS